MVQFLVVIVVIFVGPVHPKVADLGANQVSVPLGDVRKNTVTDFYSGPEVGIARHVRVCGGWEEERSVITGFKAHFGLRL